jgi:hypothetical protein
MSEYSNELQQLASLVASQFALEQAAHQNYAKTAQSPIRCVEPRYVSRNKCRLLSAMFSKCYFLITSLVDMLTSKKIFKYLDLLGIELLICDNFVTCRSVQHVLFQLIKSRSQ